MHGRYETALPVSSQFPLTRPAPDIVEAILDGKQGPEVTLAQVLEPFPLDWAEQ